MQGISPSWRGRTLKTRGSSAPRPPSSTDSTAPADSSCLSNFCRYFLFLRNHLANKMSRLGSFILDSVRGSLAGRLIIALAENITSASGLAALCGEGGEQEFGRALRKKKLGASTNGIFLLFPTARRGQADASARGCLAELALPPVRVPPPIARQCSGSPGKGLLPPPCRKAGRGAQSLEAQTCFWDALG